MDNNILLNVLSDNLGLLHDTFDENRFEFIKELALSTYASMISKKGLSESELFESVILNIESIDEYKKNYGLNNIENIRNIIDHIKKSIDIIFLSRMDMGSKFKKMGYFYNDKTVTKQSSKSQEIGSHLHQTIMKLLLFYSLSETEFRIRANLQQTIKEKLGEEKSLPSTSHELLVKTIQQ